MTRLGGRVLVIDQIAPADPLAAIELDRFERARDPSHTRLLPDTDIRSLLDANGLVLRASRESSEEPRDLDAVPRPGRLRRAGPGHGGRRRALAARRHVGWYLAAKPLP